MPRRVEQGFSVVILLISTLPLVAQSPTPRVLTGPVDEKRLVAIHGTVYPLAQSRYDRGAIPDSFPINRMLLMLQRSTEQEASLQEFLREVQNRHSARYHQWLTPQQFGQRFGPANADIQEAANWLRSRGLTVSRVTSSKTLIEFSGTAAQLRDAFHTTIHEYVINGERHYANANEISIPAALAPLVRGISPLHDFRAKPLARTFGPGVYFPSAKKTKVQWTIPDPSGSGNFYALAPEDFATQYDLLPLYQAGINGQGQIIGIINVSNIDVALTNSYRQLFGLGDNPPQVVIDGSDPGGEFPSNVEAFLDVEVSGAVAPNATVNLYISDGGTLFDPLLFAALRAVEDNQASVLSVSFGACEQSLGPNGNQLYSGLWQQAAAQGQTVLVSSGDSGSAGCDPAGFQNAFQGLGVNGIASTPWNLAVGGTDFYYSDYASGAPSAASFWNQTNDVSNGSLITPIPEQVWNDAMGLNAIPGVLPNDIAAGGGASSCALYSSGPCTGYPKPNWQLGSGVPNDGVRDIPDVSLFAADGLNLSAYPICVLAGDCVADNSGGAGVFLVGGTSASSPAMAGIMALVNQKYGRQGQANVVLYPLAQQTPSAFHDISVGGNNVPVDPTSQFYLASAGYDPASGLGSVDANILVNSWGSVQFLPTTTSIKLSGATITHGQSLTVSSTVKPASGSGTPTGAVAILTDSPLPSNKSQFSMILSNGAASGLVNFLPGGTYHIFSSYGGDSVFGMSKSSPVVLTVKPENANLNFGLLAFTPSSGLRPISNGGTVAYGSLLTFGMQPTGVSAPSGSTNGIATGNATFKVDSITQTVPLDSVGLVTWNAPALGLGSHTANASYSGDSSFNAATSSPLSFTMTQGNAVITLDVPELFGPLGTVALRNGDSLTASAVVRAPFAGLGAPPTGNVTISLGSLSQTARLSVINSYESTAQVTFQNLVEGTYCFPTASYSGDANWVAAGNGIDGCFGINPGTNAPSTTTLKVSPSSISGNETATFTVTISPAGGGGTGSVPTGFISFYDNGALLSNYVLPAPTGTATTVKATIKGIYPFQFLSDGVNHITAVYSGDCCYSPSTSPDMDLTVANNAPDFTLAPQLPQVAVKTGSSGTVRLNLSSLRGFSGIVNLSCSPSSPNLTCNLNPASAAVNGVTTTTLTINVAPGTRASSGAPAWKGTPPDKSFAWLSLTATFMFGFVYLKELTRRRRSSVLCLGLFLALVGISCGGGGGQQTSQPPPSSPPPPSASNTTYYSVLVTGTTDNVVHTSQIIVAVQ